MADDYKVEVTSESQELRKDIQGLQKALGELTTSVQTLGNNFQQSGRKASESLRKTQESQKTVTEGGKKQQSTFLRILKTWAKWQVALGTIVVALHLVHKRFNLFAGTVAGFRAVGGLFGKQVNIMRKGLTAFKKGIIGVAPAFAPVMAATKKFGVALGGQLKKVPILFTAYKGLTKGLSGLAKTGFKGASKAVGPFNKIAAGAGAIVVSLGARLRGATTKLRDFLTNTAKGRAFLSGFRISAKTAGESLNFLRKNIGPLLVSIGGVMRGFGALGKSNFAKNIKNIGSAYASTGWTIRSGSRAVDFFNKTLGPGTKKAFGEFKEGAKIGGRETSKFTDTLDETSTTSKKLGAAMGSTGRGMVQLGKVAFDLSDVIFRLFVLAVAKIIKSLGNLVQMMGVKIVRAATKQMQAFARLERSQISLERAIIRFNQSIKETSDTSDQWLRYTRQLAIETGQLPDYVNRATTALLELAAALGLNETQTKQMINRIFDLSAELGINVYEAATRFRAALAGNATSAVLLGVNLHHAKEEGGKFSETIGLSTENVKVSSRFLRNYNIIMEQTAAMHGVAAQMMDSTAGTLQRLNTSQQMLSMTMGEATSKVLKPWYDFVGNIYERMALMPGVFTTTIAALETFGGVVLVATGAIIKIVAQMVFWYEIMKLVNIGLALLKINLLKTIPAMRLFFLSTASGGLAFKGLVPAVRNTSRWLGARFRRTTGMAAASLFTLRGATTAVTKTFGKFGRWVLYGSKPLTKMNRQWTIMGVLLKGLRFVPIMIGKIVIFIVKWAAIMAVVVSAALALWRVMNRLFGGDNWLARAIRQVTSAIGNAIESVEKWSEEWLKLDQWMRATWLAMIKISHGIEAVIYTMLAQIARGFAVLLQSISNFIDSLSILPWKFGEAFDAISDKLDDAIDKVVEFANEMDKASEEARETAKALTSEFKATTEEIKEHKRAWELLTDAERRNAKTILDLTLGRARQGQIMRSIRDIAQQLGKAETELYTTSFELISADVEKLKERRRELTEQGKQEEAHAVALEIRRKQTEANTKTEEEARQAIKSTLDEIATLADRYRELIGVLWDVREQEAMLTEMRVRLEDTGRQEESELNRLTKAERHYNRTVKYLTRDLGLQVKGFDDLRATQEIVAAQLGKMGVPSLRFLDTHTELNKTLVQQSKHWYQVEDVVRRGIDTYNKHADSIGKSAISYNELRTQVQLAAYEQGKDLEGRDLAIAIGHKLQGMMSNEVHLREAQIRAIQEFYEANVELLSIREQILRQNEAWQRQLEDSIRQDRELYTLEEKRLALEEQITVNQGRAEDALARLNIEFKNSVDLRQKLAATDTSGLYEDERQAITSLIDSLRSREDFERDYPQLVRERLLKVAQITENFSKEINETRLNAYIETLRKEGLLQGIEEEEIQKLRLRLVKDFERERRANRLSALRKEHARAILEEKNLWENIKHQVILANDDIFRYMHDKQAMMEDMYLTIGEAFVGLQQGIRDEFGRALADMITKGEGFKLDLVRIFEEITNRLIQTFFQKLVDEFTTMLFDMKSEAESSGLRDALIDLFKPALQSVGAIGSFLGTSAGASAGGTPGAPGPGGGTVMPAQEGGKVPGTGTGDTVPAMLEPGEYVVQKHAVDTFGTEFFDSLNTTSAKAFRAVRDMGDKARFLVSLSRRTGVERFQTGGIIRPTLGKTSFKRAESTQSPFKQSQPQPTAQNVTIVNVTDPADVQRVLSTREGEQAILNVVARNLGRGSHLRRMILEGT
jgi:hypothetical protein